MAGSAGMSAPASGGGEAGGGGAKASGMAGYGHRRQFSSASYAMDNLHAVASLGCILRLHRALT